MQESKNHITQLSDTFEVRRLNAEDVDLIYTLSIENEIFYQYHPPFVTKESILKDMAALPPGKTLEDKFYLGFFDGEILTAVMDLILGYPTEDTGFIGLFMMNSNYRLKNHPRVCSTFARIRLPEDSPWC